MTEMIRLGARLRAARKAAGFKTSKEYVNKFKIPASTYSQHESGARTPDDVTLKFYSKALNVNYKWLSTGEGNPFNIQDSTRKSIVAEELIDLNSLRPHKNAKANNKLAHSALKNNNLIILNPKLLASILKGLLDTHNTKLSEKKLKAIANETIKIYKQFILSASLHKS